MRRLLTLIILAIPWWSAFGQQWTTVTLLPIGYQEHILVYANGFLYNIGGVSAINSEADGTNVYYVQVYTNGTIGSWSNTTPLPEAVFDSVGVADRGFVYVIAGNHYNSTNGDFLDNTVYYAKINSDGSLGNWQTANAFPQAVEWPGAAVWNHTIYASGGANSFQAFSNVYSARIQADGRLSAWVTQPSLPIALAGSAMVANGALYEIAGAQNAAFTVPNIYYTMITTDGTLAGWQRTTDYPLRTVFTAGVAVAGGLFCNGGVNGSTMSVSNSFRAIVLGDGSLGVWSVATPLPTVLTYHAATTDNSYIFVSGGNNDVQTQGNVYSMPLPPKPTAPSLIVRSKNQIHLSSSTNTGFGIQASTDLKEWTNVGWGFTDTNGNLLFTDANAINFSNRFYRSYWPLP